MGISNTFATIPGIVSPTLTGYLVQNQTAEEWRLVFYISAGIYLVGCVVYWFWASGEVQPWARLDAAKEMDAETVEKPKSDANHIHMKAGGYVNEGIKCDE